MDWIALLKTIGLCLISIIIEAASATKEGKKWFESLKQPKLSFSFTFWYVVGGLYYIICGVIAYKQFNNSAEIFTLPIILLTLVMVFNGLTNFILFKFRSLKMFYLVLYPFIALFIALIIVLTQIDKLSAGLACIYLAWLVYDLFYFLNLWRLNKGNLLCNDDDRKQQGAG
jgi:tryptophan-rich sensory protein